MSLRTPPCGSVRQFALNRSDLALPKSGRTDERCKSFPLDSSVRLYPECSYIAFRAFFLGFCLKPFLLIMSGWYRDFGFSPFKIGAIKCIHNPFVPGILQCGLLPSF